MARTKQNFTAIELPKVWLAQSQESGKTPGTGNFYFTGNTIYSYGAHFPIAKIKVAPNGEKIITFTTRSYSLTTASHVACVRNAVRDCGLRVIHCHEPDAVFHDRNMGVYKSNIDALIEKHTKARKPEIYTGGILREAERAREYCEVMCIPVPLWAQLPDMSFVEIDKLFKGAPMRAYWKLHQPDAVTV